MNLLGRYKEIKTRKFFFCGDNAKISSRLILLDVDCYYRPLESSLSLFWLCFFFVCSVIQLWLFFFLWFIGISLVKTLLINWNPRFILEPRWLNKIAKLSPISWVRIIGSSLIQSLGIIKKNAKKFFIWSNKNNKHKWKISIFLESGHEV